MCEVKICGGNCKRELPATSEFFAERKLKTKVILQWQCRECHKEYRKLHYENNKVKYIKKAKKHRAKVSNWFDNYKQNLKCQKCEEKRWWVLDFHHTDPSEKEFNIGNLKNSGSKSMLEKEIKKCIVLCSNCHRDLHYQEKIIADNA